MFVCLCKSVTDHQIRDAIDQGVTSFDAMQSHLEVSTVCGACTCEVKQVMEKKLKRELHARSKEVFLGTPAFS
jgi:bacterioferritin-associated ferredoxin